MEYFTVWYHVTPVLHMKLTVRVAATHPAIEYHLQVSSKSACWYNWEYFISPFWCWGQKIRSISWLLMTWQGTRQCQSWHWSATPGPHFNIKTIFPRYGDSHVKDKTVTKPSYLKHGDPYTGKTTSLCWDTPITGWVTVSFEMHISIIPYAIHKLHAWISYLNSCGLYFADNVFA